MENRRTETARCRKRRQHIIDRTEPTPSQGGSSGGNLQEDVATQAELDASATPKPTRESTTGRHQHQQRYPPRHPADKSSGAIRQISWRMTVTVSPAAMPPATHAGLDRQEITARFHREDRGTPGDVTYPRFDLGRVEAAKARHRMRSHLVGLSSGTVMKCHVPFSPVHSPSGPVTLIMASSASHIAGGGALPR